MAPITEDEIEPGIVVFMDSEALIDDSRVTRTQASGRFRSGPFVCVGVEEGESHWMPVTTEHRAERRVIRREWRSGGHPQWIRDDQFLNDGANILIGPNVAFIRASHDESTEVGGRARVSEEGLAAVLDELEAQRHRRD